MKKYNITVMANELKHTQKAKEELIKKMDTQIFNISYDLNDDTDLILCIGGDGTFLQTLHEFDFPKTPILGVNTGHLGFFQELVPSDFDSFIKDYIKGNYCIQKIKAVEAIVETKTDIINYTGINEIIVRRGNSKACHFSISIEDNFIENFSGDGILVATSAGSTAYNYSVGGAIVDPRVQLLQVAPISPMNTTAYRSFTTSIILPADKYIEIVPERENSPLQVVGDGNKYQHNDIKKVTIKFSDKEVSLVRFHSYNFWDTVTRKFL